ncbi:amino acid ABC transporter substrate-binding protein [Listeria cornellensis FSL F6-0969]|uniref:Amino acid ABC transporter substrate-binding protein n=1 Tax=Listeria cornellensis FSL F6-0969 TaxID=1265820 RepID=W7C610_9LIST|nr:amino acid ABC transporter substrate-binding protein [Listeria cornellensis FSL F6-0969]
MKKVLLGLFTLTLVLVLAACGGGSKDDASGDKETTLVIGASNSPHAVILEKAKPILAKKRY